MSFVADVLDPSFQPLHRAAAFVLGACFGSFFNVCIYRVPRGLSLWAPGSHCFRCGGPVRWYDNLPLISYWVLRGRCRRCGAPFSSRYFWVELLTALVFLGAYERLGLTPALLPALVFASLLIVGSFTDIDHWIIPDRVTLGGLVAGLALAAVGPIGTAAGNPLAEPVWPIHPPLPPPLVPLVNATAGAVAGFVSLWLIGRLGSLLFRKDAMGMGDVKLFAMFGAFCGPLHLIPILVIACVIGSVVGVIGIVRGRQASRRPLPDAIAPAPMAPDAVDALMAAHPLGPNERAVVRAALLHPGPVGAVRHHLPFGPSLAIAAWIVYLYGVPLEQAFVAWMLGDGLWP